MSQRTAIEEFREGTEGRSQASIFFLQKKGKKRRGGGVVGKIHFLFTKLSQERRCFNEQQYKKNLINLCRAVGYFLLEQENEHVQSALCCECIMYYGSNLRRRYSRYLERFGWDRGRYSIKAINHDSKYI